VTERTGVLFMQSQEFFGADSQIHASIMRHLPRDRFDVHCAVVRDRGDGAVASRLAVERINDVRVRPIEFGPTLDGATRPQVVRDALRHGPRAAISMLGLARYVRRNRIRIVHCTEKPRDAIYGSIVAALGGADVVIHVHVKAETWIRSGVRRAMHRAGALIGVSLFVARSICDLGYEPRRVHAVLNGLELDEWLDGEVDPGGVRDELGIGRDEPVILSASRLYRYKGHHELVAALPIVLGVHPDAMLVVVGEDDPRAYRDERSYRTELERLCVELGVREHVVFTGFRRDVRRLMSACDVYAMASFEEPFGMVFTEAMSLGKPVVALDNGGTREVVEHGRSGLLSEPGDADQLAANLVVLLGDVGLRRRMGAHGRRSVIDRLNARRMALEVAAVYDSLTGGTPSGSGGDHAASEQLASAPPAAGGR
jgi:glycosyltransferase involved in cell wall biosynthesis